MAADAMTLLFLRLVRSLFALLFRFSRAVMVFDVPQILSLARKARFKKRRNQKQELFFSPRLDIFPFFSTPLPSSLQLQQKPENLEENERIKAELNPTAIEEPKTPWHGLADSDDEEGGSAGGLGNGNGGTDNGGEGGGRRGISPLHQGADGARRFEEALAAEASFFASRNRSVSNGRASTTSGEGNGTSNGNNNSNNRNSAGGLSSSADADAESKRAAFEARRKAHYNMAEALRAARRADSRGGLNDDEEEEDDDDDNDESGGDDVDGENDEMGEGSGANGANRRRRRRRQPRRSGGGGGGGGGIGAATAAAGRGAAGRELDDDGDLNYQEEPHFDVDDEATDVRERQVNDDGDED